MDAEVRITVKDRKGVTEIYSVVNTVSGAIENAQLLARVALATRMLHAAALEQTRDSAAPGLPAADHEIYLCRCSDVLFTASEAICHVQQEHCSWEIQKDLSKVENVISAMITPDPRVS